MIALLLTLFIDGHFLGLPLNQKGRPMLRNPERLEAAPHAGLLDAS